MELGAKYGEAKVNMTPQCTAAKDDVQLAVERAAGHSEATRDSLSRAVSRLYQIQSRHTGEQPQESAGGVPCRSGAVGSIEDNLDAIDHLCEEMRGIMDKF